MKFNVIWEIFFVDYFIVMMSKVPKHLCEALMYEASI